MMNKVIELHRTPKKTTKISFAPFRLVHDVIDRDCYNNQGVKERLMQIDASKHFSSYFPT